MPVTRDTAAPYAPAKTLLDIIGRHRDRGIPAPIDRATLERIGVPETLIPRVIQALLALDLVDADGQPTPIFEGVRLASEAEYKKQMAEWLKGTYADIFSVVDPMKDGETRIRDAFRHYQPTGQQGRMVTLFVGLCTAAGLIPEKPRALPMATSVSASSGPRMVAKRIGTERVKDGARPARRPPPMSATEIHPALGGLLASLPGDGEGWTADRRAKFLKSFEAVLDLCFPIIEPADTEEVAA